MVTSNSYIFHYRRLSGVPEHSGIKGNNISDEIRAREQFIEPSWCFWQMSGNLSGGEKQSMRNSCNYRL